ncbi:MAG TPA: ABC transporter permease [Hyphomicrobiaceae bacterium]|nr:ABC transporter permease [Hyphomicrobiaceae bacterium]
MQKQMPGLQLEPDQAPTARTHATGRSGGSGSGFDDGGETRSRRSARQLPIAPIVPAGSVTGRSLTLVITIMCFLASLTAGSVNMMYQSASSWLRDIAGEVTVQVEARQGIDVDQQVGDVASFLSRQPGVARVRPISVRETSRLLEPWLGQSDALSTLPVPRLIAVEIDRINPPNFDNLRGALGARFPASTGVTIDDHRRWQRQVRTITRSFALGGIAILLLVAAATTAIIVSATKSAMASNRDIVEVLHFVGATDKFIAREFERHFMRLGVRAGIVGAVWAVLVFLSMPYIMDFLGGGPGAMSEMNRLTGITSLGLWDYFLMGIVVLVIATLCMLTSRIGVFRILNSQH